MAAAASAEWVAEIEAAAKSGLPERRVRARDRRADAMPHQRYVRRTRSNTRAMMEVR